MTSEPPWPLNSGGHIRTFHILRALAKNTSLRLVCPIQPQQVDWLAGLRDSGIEVLPIPVPCRSVISEVGKVVASELRGQPYAMFGRHCWPQVQAALSGAQANGADILYLDHLDSFGYALKSKGPSLAIPTVIDMHNVYSLLIRRAADERKDPLARLVLRREARLLQAMEQRAVRRCEKTFAVSDQEASYFRGLGARSVDTVPNGVDCAALADLPVGREGTADILFLGSMSWEPNAAAARFLALEVMPALRRQRPDTRLLIVGREPTSDVRALSAEPGVEVTGTVPDVRPYLASAAILAVPLDAGGGTRLKLLEAFAAGLPVVSTAVGAEGIAAIPGVHYRGAERPEFIEAIASLLGDRHTGRQLASAARDLAAQTYDWNQIGTAAARSVTLVAQIR